MRAIIKTALIAALSAAPLSVGWAQDPNPGNGGGDHDPVGTAVYPPGLPPNPALTTGSRFSVLPNTPPEENPTVPGATGLTIVRGDHSPISGDRRERFAKRPAPTARTHPAADRRTPS